jgi:transcriptional regulator with XRE-family HTH domain/tetratricopeptide (TPR) repeat protein
VSKPERPLIPDRSPLDRFGYELRTWRKRRGLSQERVGALVHVSGALLHRIEIGERRPSLDLATRCDAVLGADGALVRAWEHFSAAAAQDTRTRRVDTDTSASGIDKARDQLATVLPGSEIMIVSMMSLTGECVPVAVDRRAFVAGAMSLPLVGWIGRAVPQTSLPATDGNLSDVLSHMIALRSILVRQDNVLGSGAAAPTVIQTLSILESLSRSAKGSAHDSVRRLQAEYAEFAGWLADELGDRRAGQFWTDRALEWAHEIDDDLLIGYTLVRKAQRALESGDAWAAVSLARAALRRGGLTNRVRAAALQYEALGHASSHEIPEFRVSIDHAHELIDASEPAEPDERATWCTPAYVIMHEAAGWTRLGMYANAVAEYQRGLSDWPGEFRRDEGVYYGRLACAHAQAGNPEEAARIGLTALNVGISTGSARILAELRPLEQTLAKWDTVPNVSRLTASLKRALSPPGERPLAEIDVDPDTSELAIER